MLVLPPLNLMLLYQILPSLVQGQNTRVLERLKAGSLLAFNQIKCVDCKQSLVCSKTREQEQKTSERTSVVTSVTREGRARKPLAPSGAGSFLLSYGCLCYQQKCCCVVCYTHMGRSFVWQSSLCSLPHNFKQKRDCLLSNQMP